MHLQLYGGVVSKETFTRTICRLFGKRKLGKEEDIQLLFNNIKKAEEERMTFGRTQTCMSGWVLYLIPVSIYPFADEFSAYAEQKPKYSYLFTAPKEIAP